MICFRHAYLPVYYYFRTDIICILRNYAQYRVYHKTFNNTRNQKVVLVGLFSNRSIYIVRDPVASATSCCCCCCCCCCCIPACVMSHTHAFSLLGEAITQSARHQLTSLDRPGRAAASHVTWPSRSTEAAAAAAAAAAAGAACRHRVVTDAMWRTLSRVDPSSSSYSFQSRRTSSARLACCRCQARLDGWLKSSTCFLFESRRYFVINNCGVCADEIRQVTIRIAAWASANRTYYRKSFL